MKPIKSERELLRKLQQIWDRTPNQTSPAGTKDKVGPFGGKRGKRHKGKVFWVPDWAQKAAEEIDSDFENLRPVDMAAIIRAHYQEAQPELESWTTEWVRSKVGHFSVMEQKYRTIAELHNATLK